MRLALKKSTLLSLWMALGIALLPIYLWSSGGVQLSHAILFIGAAIIIIRHGLGLEQLGGVFGLLFLYAALAGAFFLAQEPVSKNLSPILHVFFSWIVYLAVRVWCSTEYEWRLAARATLVAAGIAVIGVLALGYSATGGAGVAHGTVEADAAYRSVGTFNNPNQLGYFSVCLASFSALFFLRGVISRRTVFLFFGAALFLSTASLSKASMVSCALGLAVLSLVVAKSRAQFACGMVALLALVVVLAWLASAGHLDQFKFFNRLTDIGGQSDDSLEGRGYQILLNAGAMELLFGYGLARVDEIVGHEVHSTIASFFANYGLIGGMLFVLLLALWARRVFKTFGVIGLISIIVPPMLYGITHNGSRFTIFWILIAMSMSAAPVDYARERHRRHG